MPKATSYRHARRGPTGATKCNVCAGLARDCRAGRECCPHCTHPQPRPEPKGGGR